MSARVRIAGLVLGATLLTELPAAAAESSPSKDAALDTRPTRPLLIGVHTLANRGTFAAVPVTRVGAMIEGRPRNLPFIGVTATLEGGTTDNGLGAHRLELAFDARTPWPVLSVRGGVHTGYAVLVRATGHDRLRSAWGDIASLSIGVHAAIEGMIPLGGGPVLVLGVRGMVETYDGARGAAFGPQLGVVF